MKLTKKLEAEVLKVYNSCWDAYLAGDIKTHGSFLSDEFKIIGTSESEQFKNKKEWLAYCKKTIKQFAGVVRFKKRDIKLEPVGEEVMVTENSDIYVLIDGKWNFYSKVRITALLQKENGKWKYIHQHGSLPDAKANEGEVIATEQIKTENLQLRDAVKRRTIELEEKNRELEIETALERVRTVAMSMKEPADMLEVCKTISQQLESLNVKEIRNIQTAIFYPDKGTYINYEYYAKHKKLLTTEVDYNLNKEHAAFANQMLKGAGEFYTHSFKGKKLKDWYAYQKTTNQFADKYLEKANSLNYYMFSLGEVMLGISTYYPLSEEEISLFKRFKNVFELAYRRYQDIEKAETQAREAQIEASLEKVRAQALGMHKPDDLLNVCEVLFKELLNLGFNHLRNALIHTFYDEKDYFRDHDYSDFNGGAITNISYDQPIVKRFLEEIRKSDNAFSQMVVAGNELKEWKKFRKKGGQKDDPRLDKVSAIYYYVYSIGVGSIGISTFEAVDEEKLQVLKRFRNVFDFAYKRYTDVANAEAQAREAQIELALERVRARTMAMQKSDELKEVIQVVYEQFVHLNINTEHTGFVMDYKERDDRLIWVASKHGVPSQLTIPYFDSEYYNSFNEAKEKGWDFFATNLSFEEKNSFYQQLFTYIPGIPEEAKEFYFSCQGLAISTVLLENVGLYIENFEGIPYSYEDNAILMRFGKVFQQTYTRFLDLQKAEAQARESQIQLALERVRARTMAMHKSEELAETAHVLFQQLIELGGFPDRISIGIADETNAVVNFWTTDQQGSHLTHSFTARLNERTTIAKTYHAWKEKKKSLVIDLHGEELKEWIQFAREEMGIAVKDDQIKDRRVHSLAFFSHGWILVTSHEPQLTETIQILERFASVFNLTYRRFLDLQKAEAQSREAQIELGLERVRAKAMAMQRSEELKELIGTVFTELTKLDIVLTRCLIMIYDPKTKNSTWWMANSEAPTEPIGLVVQYHEHPPYLAYINAWQEKNLKWQYILEGAVKKDWDDFLFVETELSHLPDFVIAGMKAPNRVYLNASFNSFGNLTLATLETLSEEHFDIMLRFAKVFDLTYTRFNDLQKAEAQARESQIQLALERVRARTMAMQKSDELAEAASLLFQQIKSLGIETFSSGYTIWENDNLVSWMCNADGSMNPPFIMPVADEPWHVQQYKSWENGEDFIVNDMTGKRMKSYFRYLRSFPLLDVAFKTSEVAGHPIPERQVHNAANFSQGNLLFITYEQVPEAQGIFIRFAKVFEQTYTRFLDLQKAEAQAREAQIEAALERVRSKTMAMHHSEELLNVITTLTEQLQQLGFRIDTANFNTNYRNKDWELWTASNGTDPIQVYIPYFDHPIFNKIIRALENGEDFFVDTLNRQEKDSFLKHLFENTIYKDLAEEGKKDLLSTEGFTYSVAFSKHTSVTIGNYEPLPYSQQQNDILRRFGNVFEQSYTRFLDLQKAEAQSREAQIELGLERVRAKAMAMQRSDELKELIGTVFTELTKLDIVLTRCVIMIFDPKTKDSTWWMANSEAPSDPIGLVVQYHELPGYLAYMKAWEEKQLKWQYILEGATKKQWDDFLFVETGLSHLPDFVIAGMKAPDRVYLNASFNSFGNLTLATLETLSEEHFDIMLRFAKVFDLTYTRFNDLQKAEAQAREAQIELALERVRARTMAMQKSDELREAVLVIYEQLQQLNFESKACNIIIIDKESGSTQYWVSGFSQEIFPESYTVPYFDHPYQDALLKPWKQGDKYVVYEYTGKMKQSFDEIFFTQTEFRNIPEDVKKVMMSIESVMLSTAFINYGALQVLGAEPLSEEKANILKRFAKVFEQTYTRFLDLQKAEAQSKEAKIEAALERVRSRTMAMHKSDELAETAVVLFKQMIGIGIEPNRLYIAIINDNSGDLEFWITDENGDKVSSRYIVNIHKNSSIKTMYEGWVAKKKTITIDMQGNELEDWLTYWKEEFNVPFKPGAALKRRVQNIAYFSKGFVAIASPDDQPETTNNLLERFAAVFNLTYTRFNDLQQAEAQAREAKIEASLERVRSKTMAMHKSDELLDIIIVVSEQLQQLSIKFGNVSFGVNNKNYDLQLWMAVKGYPQAYHIHWTFLDNPGVTKLKEAQQQPEKVYADVLTQAENNEWLQHIFNCNPAMDIFSDEAKDKLLNSRGYARSIAVMKDIFLVIGNYAAIPYSDDENTIFKRFANVFEQAYKRFLDLQNAEAQAREARIEAVLERVRSRTMAMQKSDELTDVAGLLFEQVSALGIKTWTAGFNVWSEDNNSYVDYITSPQGGFIKPYTVYTDTAEALTDLSNARKSGVEFDVQYVEGEKIKQLYLALTRLDEKQYEIMLRDGVRFPSHQYDHFVFGSKVSLMFITYEPVPEAHDIFKRLGKVFEQTYTRFLDLQKAEAQAREATIEAALERVRYRAMAMQSSSDVGEATSTMFAELDTLGIETFRCGIAIVKDEELEVWSMGNTGDGRMVKGVGRVAINQHPLWQLFRDSWKRKDDFLFYYLTGKEKDDYVKVISTTASYSLTQTNLNFPDLNFQAYNFEEGGVFSFSLAPHSETDKQVMKRFTNVFSLTFRRYQDLQKTEAQAREAKIEAALEKVRSRTMAMQHSNELFETASVLFEQLQQLGEQPERTFIGVINEEEYVIEIWATQHGGTQMNMMLKATIDEPTVMNRIYVAWKQHQKSIVIDLHDEELESYFQFLKEIGAPVKREIFGERRLENIAFFSKGMLGVITPEPQSAEAIQLYERFAGVFDLTYTRFLDLQKAEASAREATIEAALERVRGKAMAMHNSNDLSSAASMVFTELRRLGINPIRCGVGLLTKESRKGQLYSATSSPDGDGLSLVGWVILSGHPVLENIYDAWLKNEEYYPELSGEQLRSYYELLLKGLPVTIPDSQNEQKQYGTFLPFSVGCLYAWSKAPYNDTEIKILKRFASIIDLTFRRYLELQKSEANAREAVKQSALDRVRADIASMRTTNDLDRITPLIWNELTILGIPFIRCGVFIMDESQQLIHTFLSTPDGKAIAAFHLPYDTPGNIGKVLDHWRNKENYIDHWDEKEFNQFAEILVQQGALDSAEKYLKTIPHGGFALHFLPFLQGMLYVGNTTQLNNEQIKLIQHVADAFSTAYARYEDFNKLEAAKQQVDKTLVELKQAQTQLVQSEKMASLGELTAGIAHEIQNPLNFVNNFSEVSNELLDEMMEEVAKGNYEEVKEIVNDVKQNLEKINHHGKRADGIVKGMLQHSRTNSGQKELTSINDLTDEYLRLDIMD